jgi:hypothetical protein
LFDSSNPVTADSYGNAGAWLTPGQYDYWVTASAVNHGPYHVTLGNPQSTVYADQYSGADIGAKINAAFTACSNACTVYVPAGAYSYSTTIAFPASTDDGKASLECNSGAVMTYTGSGDAFTAIPTSTAPNAANVKVTGCTFVGTSSAANGIHTKVFNKGTFTNVTVRGFTAATAACVLNEGTNTVDYVSPNLKSCGYAIRNVGVVYLAANYAANAINVIGGHLTGCVTRCIFEDATLSGTVGLNDGNHYIGTTIDGNNTQNVFIQGCNACTFQGGYQEEPAGSSVARPFVVGDGTYTAYSLNVNGVVFASIGATGTIQLVRSQNAVIEGNSELASTTGKMVNLSANALRTRVGINLAYSNGDLVDGVIDASTTYWDPTNIRWQMPAIYSANVSTFSAGMLVGAGTIRPSAAGALAVGTSALPFSGIYIGGSATNNALIAGTFGQATVVTLPDPGAASATISLLKAQDCGTTTTCAHTDITGTLKLAKGSVALATGSPSTATVTGISPAFTSSSSFVCTVSNATTQANPVKVVNASASSITVTGPNTVTDVVNYVCVGT